MNVKKLRFWCHKVLPLVYDDSLSYYEVLCKVVDKINEIIENPVGIKIADPIEWDITRQYPYNTLVIDSDGSAYISVQPVPVGIELENEDYWQLVFSYGETVHDIKASITTISLKTGNIERNMTAGELVWYGNKIYILTEDLPAGALLLPDTNCELITIEEWVNGIKSDLNDDINDINTHLDTVDDSLEDINDSITTITGDIGDINTNIETIEGNIETINGSIEEINGEIDSINDTIEEILNTDSKNTMIYDTVADMVSDTEVDADTIAITRGYYSVNDGGGAIYKIVEAQPNEPYSTLDNGLYASMILKDVVTPQMFGAKGDGVADDTQAFVKMFTCDKDDVFIPSGNYVVNEIIFVDNDKKVNNLGVFPNHKPIWRRAFDLKQASLFGEAKEFNLSTTQAYAEGIAYDSRRNKIYVGTRNMSQTNEYLDLITLNADTLAVESTRTFQIAAIASMSYNAVNDKLYITTTGGGNGKTNALYSISVSTWTLDGAVSTPYGENFTMFDSAAKTFVSFYIDSSTHIASIRVLDETASTVLKTLNVALLSTDAPQQGFEVYDGHVYTPTYYSLLEIDYITGEVNRLDINYNGQTGYEEIEDFTVAKGVIYALGHRDGTNGVERIYIYGYDSYVNYVTINNAFIIPRLQAVTGGDITIAAGGIAETPTFTRPTLQGYTHIGTFVEDKSGGGSGYLIPHIDLTSNKVQLYNPSNSTVTLTGLILRYLFIRNDLMRLNNINL